MSTLSWCRLSTAVKWLRQQVYLKNIKQQLSTLSTNLTDLNTKQFKIQYSGNTSLPSGTSTTSVDTVQQRLIFQILGGCASATDALTIRLQYKRSCLSKCLTADQQAEITFQQLVTQIYGQQLRQLLHQKYINRLYSF